MGCFPSLGKNFSIKRPKLRLSCTWSLPILVYFSTTIVMLNRQPLRYKRILSLLTTMLDSEYRLSSTWFYHLKECECLKSLFSRLKYAQLLINSTSNTFVSSRVADSQPSQASAEMTSCDVTRVVWYPSRSRIRSTLLRLSWKTWVLSSILQSNSYLWVRKLARTSTTMRRNHKWLISNA